MANILIANVQVPFTKGGQDVLVNTLKRELLNRGHRADIISLPYAPLPKYNLLKQVALWRSVDIQEFAGHKVDLVVCTKFPSYYIKHPNKSLWLVHQHRAIYDLYGTMYSDFGDDPRDEQLREMLYLGDIKAIKEHKFKSAISKNVANRLKRYCDIDAEVLYPPLPDKDRYYCKDFQNYILAVGRICRIKRWDLMLKSLPMTHNFIKLKIVGVADEPEIMDYLNNEIDKHHLWDRVEFLGRVDSEELLKLYANSLAVFYAPYNEDYGYVTLEAMASGKPVITADDSGGVLEFIKDGENGLICAPNLNSIAKAVNTLAENKDLAKKLGRNGRLFIEENKDIFFSNGWNNIIVNLLSPICDYEAKKVSA